MKHVREPGGTEQGEVAPFTGAWIETTLAITAKASVDVAPFTGAWIETGGVS